MLLSRDISGINTGISAAHTELSVVARTATDNYNFLEISGINTGFQSTPTHVIRDYISARRANVTDNLCFI